MNSLKNCTLLNCSINDILDYASINSDSFKVNSSQFDLSKFINSIIEIVNY